MATNDIPDFDDLEPVETNDQDDDSDAEWLGLEPGESVVGEVRAVRPNSGKYDNTVIELARGLGDYDPDERTLKFINRPEPGTRLKRGDMHQRKVVLSEMSNKALHEYVERERYDVHDDHGRRPLFESRRGRPAKSTIPNWVYQVTLPRPPPSTFASTLIRRISK